MKDAISIIIPIYNEEENIEPLYKNLVLVLKNLEHKFEIIFINDGSSDSSMEKLDEISDKDENVKVINFRKNFGQTAAMMAGIDISEGNIIIPMDGDLQNDPSDIPKLILKIEEGFDVCSGWRKDRKDNPIKRNLPSKIANWLISRISGVYLHDYGCSLKAYKREILNGVRLYGEMHRFIPIYASWQGAKVTEVPVTHHPRIHGESKYGLERTIKVILDLLVVKFLANYSHKPMHLFGTFGLLSILFSFLCFFLMVYYKFFMATSFIQTPLPLLAVVFFLIGLLSILNGFIAEVLMRTYFESQNKPTYLIKTPSKNKKS
ncbi:MAG: glycosyltransferase family 2 protein [Desulfobacterales bacterium]|nr:glycosyltransferase family 2 protein [Desulfobacterales bacterium]MBF0398334.1 glycosyltransferase family 2 protein [Desulfobacterales bacterium]